MSEIKIGKYKHFKGKEYEVLYIAKHSESMEDMVVYRGLYDDEKIWVRPASMWNDIVIWNGEKINRFSYIKPPHYLFLIKEFLEKKNITYDDFIIEQVVARKNGKEWSFTEHIQALIYSQLTNQTKWSRIVPHLKEIDQLFFSYDSETIKSTQSSYFTEGLFGLKCGNISTAKQMEALADNIKTFEQIERDFGSIDNFVTSKSPSEIVKMLSYATSKYKLAMVGEALAWEYLRNVGIDGAKPDTHIRRFLGKNRMGVSEETDASIEEAICQIDHLSEETGLAKSTIDGLIWNFCADGYGEICVADPHCDCCPIKSMCHYEKNK